jgi:hypothetical protein
MQWQIVAPVKSLIRLLHRRVKALRMMREDEKGTRSQARRSPCGGKRTSLPTSSVTDPTLARYAMVRPVLTALLHSLKRARIERLGGADKVTLEDLAREYRQGSGDSGICFEYAVHDALLTKHPHVHSRVSEALEKFCRIKRARSRSSSASRRAQR